MKNIEKLLKKIKKIPESLWEETDGKMYKVIWLLNRQKPSVEASWDFDEERIGITKDGKIIYGFDSGCSCPSPWSSADFGDANYKLKEWKEFIIEPKDFDIGWDEEIELKAKEILNQCK